MLVDSANIDVLVDVGTVGFNSTFIANVKGLYSIINEGSVSFYVNDESIGKGIVVDGIASIKYMPLIAGSYTIKAVYSDSVNFLNEETNASYTVAKADSKIIIGDLTGSVGYASIINSNVISSNNLNINEGTLTFLDGDVEIGTSNVNNGFATLTYIPTRAGEHTISAVFSSDNYISSNSTSKVIVNKADSNIIFNEVPIVYYSNPTIFTVNVLSNGNAISEGGVKFYINGIEIEHKNVNDGIITFEYISDNAGAFDIVAIFEETSNYLSSNANYTFAVDKLPTTITASSISTVYNGNKYLVVTLKDVQGNAISNATLSVNLNGAKTITTDVYGQAKLTTNNLAPKTSYTATITYVGNNNYDKSTEMVKVTVKKATPKLTAKAKTLKRSDKTKKYTVTLKTNQNKVMKSTTVKITVNKKTYTAKTNSKGVATFKLTKLTKKGKYTAVVKYAGSKYYNVKTVKPKITVK